MLEQMGSSGERLFVLFFFIWETIFAVVCMSVLILVMVPYGSKKKGLVEKKKNWEKPLGP